MLAVFLARIRPASSMPNPACIRNTRNAAISTHIVSMPVRMSAIWVATDASWANAGAPASNPNRATRLETRAQRLALSLFIAG